MTCKHCGRQIVRTMNGYEHHNGFYYCPPTTYAEPADENPEGVIPDEPQRKEEER